MKKSNKIIVGVVVVALVASVAVLAGQADLFQGRLKLFRGSPQISRSVLFWWRNRVVSAVTSPVTSAVSSVVVSNVSSRTGSSRVASVVTSPVASAVASAVALDRIAAAKVDTKGLQTLTGSMLNSLAKQDYLSNPTIFTAKAKADLLANPGKFTLSATAKKKLIDIYKLKNPAQFTSKKL